MPELIISQHLHGADVRMLACRAEPDTRVAGCYKMCVTVNGRDTYLCSLRVEAFIADATSLAGLTCVPGLPDPHVEDADLPDYPAHLDSE